MKIVFLDASTLGETSLAPIETLGELVCYDCSTHAEALERVRDAEVIITNKVVIDDDVMAAASSLKLICEAATGVNNIDLEAAHKRGIPVRNVAGYSTESVVQLTFALLLELVCRVAKHSAWVHDGHYSSSPIFTNPAASFMELSGRTMGIVGMGTIGQRVAQVATSFGMKVIYFSTSGTSHCKEYPSVTLDQLLAESDVVSIHAPMNERTRGLIGHAELAKMKPTSFIINIGRGGIVDEAALSEAVGDGIIAGAGLDVFACEPLPAESPLLHCKMPDNLIFTPHIGWASNEALGRLIEGIAVNIREK